MTDIVSGEVYTEMLRPYKNDVLNTNGGLVVHWSYSEDRDSIFVGNSLCSPNDNFDKNVGNYMASHRLSDIFEGVVENDRKHETYFVISNGDITDYLENINKLEEFWNIFSSKVFQNLIYKPIFKKYSQEFIHQIVVSSVVELWKERFDIDDEYKLNRLVRGK